jgi:DNA repair photolyase
MEIHEIQSQSILTRSSGYLSEVCSHSLQPYRGCALGKSLCGVGCYAQHQQLLVKGREWGQFLDVKSNAAQLYLQTYNRERAWAHRTHGDLSVFMSSSTEPFPPQERQLGVTEKCLEAMIQKPPDSLIIQTHSHLVGEHLELLIELSKKTKLRIHLSIETDIERIIPLPGHFSSVQNRLKTAGLLKLAGLYVVITVAPLLPLNDPDQFFKKLATVADAVVIDHFIGGDGSANGSRTFRTKLPEAIRSINPNALDLNYREEIANIALSHFPGKVGIGIKGFAGMFSFGTN